MSCTIKDIIEILERIAPVELQEEWDNSGLMIGATDTRCNGLYLDLDITSDTVHLAKEHGVNTILTHHPLLFSPPRQLNTNTPLGGVIREAMRADIQVIAAHTNLDRAQGGVNDALAARLGIEDPMPIQDAIGRVADVPETTAGAWLSRVASALRVQPRFVGEINKHIRRVGVAGGAGGELIELAPSLDLDLVITAEIKHHQAIFARETGLFVIDAGHYETEYPVLGVLAAKLEQEVNLPVYVAPFVPPFSRVWEEQ